VATIHASALGDLPEVHAGDDLAALIVTALDGAQLPGALHDGQIVAIAHKVVSKAEGAVVDLSTVIPGERARELAREQGKDARAVQVVLDQSAEILRAGRSPIGSGVLICRTHHGFVCANAGVDASNVSHGDGAEEGGIETGGTDADRARGDETETRAETLILLPRDPDASARALRARLRELTGTSPAVLITDSFGRAWRHGQCDVAIGCAGMTPLEDWRGRTDSVGLELRATWLAVADAAAAAADLARAKDSREPVVLIDGLQRFVTAEDGSGAAALLRPLEEDLFR
jgi:coenzyme F420-0:L-glutamate ligase / coenzyme F420-1:gamma-L-glutamate ligase